jgi:hypothetical protein
VVIQDVCGTWTGLIWLRMGIKGADACECRREYSGFKNFRGISWLPEELLASQEGRFSMETVGQSVIFCYQRFWGLIFSNLCIQFQWYINRRISQIQLQYYIKYTIGVVFDWLFCWYTIVIKRNRMDHIGGGGHAVAQWLRHCATNRKVALLILDGVTVIFHWHNSSGRNMLLGLTQPLTEMSTRDISWG